MSTGDVTSYLRRLPWRDIEKPALVAAWLGGLLLAAQAFNAYASVGKLGADSHAYWMTGHTDALYSAAPGTTDAFLYSPAFAQVIYPLTLLPWPVFFTVWLVAEVAAFLWLLRPVGWRWAVPLVLWCSSELVVGNVVPFLGAAAVVGLTRPGVWAAVALMKPMMALGPVWAAARGDWRGVGVAAWVTLAVVGLSFAAAPAAWVEWVTFLVDSAADQGGDRGLLWRLPLAVVVVCLGARTRRPWLLVPAMLLATPTWAGAASLTLLAALPRLVGPLGAGLAGGGVTEEAHMPLACGGGVVRRDPLGGEGVAVDGDVTDAARRR